MSVGLRCPRCRNVFNVPDRVFGKSVRCTSCGQVLRVRAQKEPEEDSESPPVASKAPTRRAPAKKKRRRTCPHCGLKVSPQAVECHACHGLLSADEPQTGVFRPDKRKRNLPKTTDPDRYFQECIRDSVEFWKANRHLSIRLALMAGAAVVLLVFFVCVALWAELTGIRYLALFCGAACLLSALGLAWHLQIAIVWATFRKKARLDDHRFDPLMGALQGLLLLGWFLDVAAPAHLLAGMALIAYSSGVRMALPIAIGLEGGAFLFASLLFPVATSHMAMPVTKRGWLIHKLWRGFSRTLPGVLHWCLLLFALLVPSLVLAAGGAFFCAPSLSRLMEVSAENSKIAMVKAEIADLPSWKEKSEEQREYQMKQPQDLPWSALVAPVCLVLLATSSLAGGAVFVMRANGLFTLHFLGQLDLELTSVEPTYIPKGVSIDQIQADRVTWKTTGICLVATLGIGALFGASVALAFGTSPLVGSTAGFCLAGILLLIGSYFTLLMEAFGDNTFWFLAMVFGMACLAVAVRLGVRFIAASAMAAAASGNFTNFLLVVWGAGTIGPFAALTYGVLHWGELKYPATLLVAGYLSAGVGAVACMALSLA